MNGRETIPAMGKSKTIAAVAFVAILVFTAFSPAHALEPRPWLCRSKPVFSSGKTMTYAATNQGSHPWILTFMRFDADGGHDGFTVISTRDVTGHVRGTLQAGQWYAVALYRSGSHWICPGWAQETDEPAPGTVSNLCYNAETPGCAVKLTVRPAAEAGGPPQ
jgi:hypothetical protein